MPKTVQLSEDAYRTLAAVKKPGESFSQTVTRLVAGQKDLSRLRHFGPPLKGYSLEDDRRRRRPAELRRMRALGILPPPSPRRRR